MKGDTGDSTTPGRAGYTDNRRCPGYRRGDRLTITLYSYSGGRYSSTGTRKSLPRPFWTAMVKPRAAFV